jgi:heptosyltransferase-2
MLEHIINSSIGSNCISFADLTIEETMPIIKNCNLYIGNDTGWLHISSGLGVRCLALFMDSPVMAYGKYSKNISVVIPDGETEETTTHNTLGKDKISFKKVYIKALELLS